MKDIKHPLELQPLGRKEFGNWVLSQQAGVCLQHGARLGCDSSFLPVFALCRSCSKFKKQFTDMVNIEARQHLGVGLGCPKLRFSVRN